MLAEAGSHDDFHDREGREHLDPDLLVSFMSGGKNDYVGDIDSMHNNAGLIDLQGTSKRTLSEVKVVDIDTHKRYSGPSTQLRSAHSLSDIDTMSNNFAFGSMPIKDFYPSSRLYQDDQFGFDVSFNNSWVDTLDPELRVPNQRLGPLS
jgi:hypothetical protein